MNKRGVRLFFVSVVIFFFSASYSFGQLTNTDSITSLLLKTDIIDSSSQKDSILPNTKTYDEFLRELLSKNKYINFSNNALPAENISKSCRGKEWIFYLLSVDLVLLGLFKVFYTKYFKNIFRVFLIPRCVKIS